MVMPRNPHLPYPVAPGSMGQLPVARTTPWLSSAWPPKGLVGKG